MLFIKPVVAPITGFAVPARNYQRELNGFEENGQTNSVSTDAELMVAINNPVANLPFDTFVHLLSLAIQSHDFGTGSAKTRTNIEMRFGLRMLTGEKVSYTMPEPFNWASSFQLLGPFVAFIYQRMHTEVRMLETVALPE